MSAGYGSVWLERTAGGREVAGSNPVTPIDRAAEAAQSEEGGCVNRLPLFLQQNDYVCSAWFANKLYNNEE